MKTIAFYSDARGYLEKKDRIKKIRIISGDLYRCNIASMPRICHKGELTRGSYGPVQTSKLSTQRGKGILDLTRQLGIEMEAVSSVSWIAIRMEFWNDIYTYTHIYVLWQQFWQRNRRPSLRIFFHRRSKRPSVIRFRSKRVFWKRPPGSDREIGRGYSPYRGSLLELKRPVKRRGTRWPTDANQPKNNTRQDGWKLPGFRVAVKKRTNFVKNRNRDCGQYRLINLCARVYAREYCGWREEGNRSHGMECGACWK